MMLVAVVGVLLGLGLETTKLLRASRLHQQRAAQWSVLEDATSSRVLEMERRIRNAEELLAAVRAGRAPGNLEEPERSMMIQASQESPIAYQKWLDESARRAEAGMQISHNLVHEWSIAVRYYADLRIKYNRAARYPWLPVPPDPPPPN